MTCQAEYAKAQEELSQLYAQIPKVKGCKNCGDCCGPIACTKAEREAIRAYCSANGIPYHHLSLMNFLFSSTRDVCPYRSGGKCAIYPVRPVICRLFGAVKGQRQIGSFINRLDCPNDAKPDRWLSMKECDKIMRRVECLSGRHF